MALAVQAENLGKCYRVSRSDPRGMYSYRTLRDEIARWVAAPLRFLKRSAGQAVEFWALRDVSFAVEAGEVLGVIGRNGAGKSTLLKILSRVTKPTTGEVRLRGRVGSLLEVGSGFHPELTGRENIYLYGAVLGMRRHEITRKFDRIVEFAEVEAFLDTPVKRYSSGMYVRLAFAVAAHLEPEILIVDEVLAVGDLGFQRRCMERMREVGRSGCTVLFVSHSMPAVESLCTRVMLLDQGRVQRAGDVRDVVREYHRRLLDAGRAVRATLDERNDPGRRVKVFRSATLLDEDGGPTNHLPLGGAFHLRVELDAPNRCGAVGVTVGIDDTLGHRLLSLVSPITNPVVEELHGPGRLDCRVPFFPLAPGDYWIKLGLKADGQEIDQIERVLHFSVTDADAFGDGVGAHSGLCVASSRWRYEPLPSVRPENAPSNPQGDT
ncbi:MAG: ABC transporter ATP-binding protein [Gemmataceae bacterium]|nr:ABC transporter ATP-binding protein [Gemmataceae bacterium]